MKRCGIAVVTPRPVGCSTPRTGRRWLANSRAAHRGFKRRAAAQKREIGKAEISHCARDMGTGKIRKRVAERLRERKNEIRERGLIMWWLASDAGPRVLFDQMAQQRVKRC